MKKLLSLLSAAALFLALVPKLHASALSNGTFIPADAARAYFGDEISCTYYTSQGLQSATFRYYGTDSFSSIPGYSGSENAYLTSATFLVYSASLTGLLNDPTQIVVDIEPQYSIFDTNQIHCAIGLTGDAYSTAAYTSASWDWYFNGSTQHFEAPLNEYDYGLRAVSSSYQSWYNLVPVAMSSQSTTSGYSLRAVFPVSTTTAYLVIGCPYVSLGSSGESGIGSFGSGSSATTSGSSSAGSNVDMSETNGILDAIRSGISGLAQSILDGLVFLFVPREGFFDSLLAQMRARFSWYTSIENAFNAIRESFSGSDFNTPPNVTVDGDNRTFFGAPIGSFSAPALVLDWFTAHRAAARTVQSAFMWLFFLFRIYKHLPAIIAGNEGALDESGGDE